MSDKPTRIGCLFGSFNPVHTGHLIIAEFMASQTDLAHVEMIVSPQNPLKDADGLAGEHHRLEMARLAVRGNPALEVNDVEFRLPRPSYTIDTLRHLANAAPSASYVLIMGSDNLAKITEWKEWHSLLDAFECYVYLRRGHAPGYHAAHPNVRIFESPYLDISATYIRQCLAAGHSIRYLVPDSVESYIRDQGLYAALKTA